MANPIMDLFRTIPFFCAVNAQIFWLQVLQLSQATLNFGDTILSRCVLIPLFLFSLQMNTLKWFLIMCFLGTISSFSHPHLTWINVQWLACHNTPFYAGHLNMLIGQAACSMMPARKPTQNCLSTSLDHSTLRGDFAQPGPTCLLDLQNTWLETSPCILILFLLCSIVLLTLHVPYKILEYFFCGFHDKFALCQSYCSMYFINQEWFVRHEDQFLTFLLVCLRLFLSSSVDLFFYCLCHGWPFSKNYLIT